MLCWCARIITVHVRHMHVWISPLVPQVFLQSALFCFQGTWDNLLDRYIPSKVTAIFQKFFDHHFIHSLQSLKELLKIAENLRNTVELGKKKPSKHLLQHFPQAYNQEAVGEVPPPTQKKKTLISTHTTYKQISINSTITHPPFLQLAENCREVLLSTWKSDKFLHLYDSLIEMCGDYPWDFFHTTGTELPPDQPPFGSESAMNSSKIKEQSTNKASTTKVGSKIKICFAISDKI